jgi:hypothetical protein
MKEAKKYQYEIPNRSDDEYTDSSSEELIIERKPKKSKGGGSSDKRMDSMERMLLKIAQQVSRPKKKRVERKTIIQLPAQIAQHNPKHEVAKQRMLLDLS